MAKKKKQSFNKWLQKHIDKRHIVKVHRIVTDGEADIYGFILKMSDDFLLLQQAENFDLDGYAIIRKDHFEGVRCNHYDKTNTKILKKEGIIKVKYGINYKVDLSSWKTIFESLKSKDIHAIVECEDLKESEFYIGEIVKVSNKSVHILYYDANGLLDKKPMKVKFKDITILKFDDRYSTTFRKYLKTQ